MTFDILIFHDFSMTFNDHQFFHDFPWLSMTVGILSTAEFWLIWLAPLFNYFEISFKATNNVFFKYSFINQVSLKSLSQGLAQKGSNLSNNIAKLETSEGKSFPLKS